MKIKIQIKSVLGEVLFELEKENNTIKETLETRTLETRTLNTRTLETRTLNTRTLETLKIKKMLFYLYFASGVVELKEI